ncbi:MAG: twin-arginine translocation signal domain-containing protein [Pirellulaceae bacterium]
MEQKQSSRRGFMKTSAATAAIVSSVGGQLTPARAAGSNQRLRIGFIGPGGRGFGAHVKKLCQLHQEGANIELVAVAEVYSVQP